LATNVVFIEIAIAPYGFRKHRYTKAISFSFIFDRNIITLPDDLTPLHKQRKTRIQATIRHINNSHLIPPMLSMPSVIFNTWFLKWQT